MDETKKLGWLEGRRRSEPPDSGPIGPTLEDLAPVAEFAPLVDKARSFKDGKHALRTRREYRKEWERFERWCLARRFDALPALPATIALYATWLATTPWRDRYGNVRNARGRSPSGIGVAVAAIAYEHAMAKKQSAHVHSDVAAVLAGIKRKWAEQLEPAEGASESACTYCNGAVGRRPHYDFSSGPAHVECHDVVVPPSQRSPVLAGHVVAMAGAQPARRIGIRNRALLLILWSGAFRRDELVHLVVEQLEFCAEGLRVRLGKSKTNQTGKKKPPKAIPFERDEAACPVRALKAWLEESGITTGYIFLHVDRWGALHQRLSGHAIACIVKSWAPSAGLDPRMVSGHSPRSGFITSAAKAKKTIPKMMAQTGQKKVDTLLGYIQDEEVFDDAAAAGLLSKKAAG